MQKKETKAKLFDIRRFPMDMARLVCAVLPLIYRMKRLTPEGQPYRNKIRGGALIAANHTAFRDPFVVGVAVWYRRLFFLAADVVMKGKLRRWLLKGVGAVEIHREGADLEAIKKSVKILKDGHLMAVFPQGGIQQEEGIGTVKSGAALMALQAGVPIIPMYICPRQKWYHRQKVVIGTAIDPGSMIQKKFPSTQDIAHITQALTDEMERCRCSRKE